MAQKIMNTDEVSKLLSSIDENQASSLTLAYVGDSVYELTLRTIALGRSNTTVNALDKFVKGFTSAKTQAKLAELISEHMTEQEMRVYKRGRNAKSITAPHTCSISEYRRATGLECLMGYLHITGESDRVLELITKGIEAYERAE